MRETIQLFPVLWGLWQFYLIRGELQTARQLGKQLLSSAQHAQDPDLLLKAHDALGATLFFLGEFSPAQAHMEQGIALYDPQRHRALVSLYGGDSGVACLYFVAWSLWMLGHPDQGFKMIHEALTLVRELAHPFTLAEAVASAAVFHQYRRERQVVQEQAAAAIALSAEQGFLFWLAAGTFLRGWALTEQGQDVEGIAQMRQGLGAQRATGAELVRSYFLALLAEAYGKVKQAEEGLRMLAEALAAVAKTGEHSYEAELHRLKGELLLRQAVPDEPQAESCFRQALDIARRQQAKSLELRAAMSLSRLWQEQGKRQEAHDLLAPIYGWFTEGFDTADLQEARALLAALL